MFTPPPLPGWDGLHPLVVHFPIALLLVAPLLVLFGLVIRPWRHGLHGAALLLMLLGTAGAYLSMETGEATAEMVDRTDGVNALIERHSELAESTCIAFTVLSALWLVLLLASGPITRRFRAGGMLALTCVYLAGYGAGMLLLANTGHLGGRLVHEQGVRAGWMPPTPSTNAGTTLPHAADRDGDD